MSDLTSLSEKSKGPRQPILLDGVTLFTLG